MVKLWAHECKRVYGDRLVSPEHLKTFNQNVFEVVKKNFPKYSLGKYFNGQSPQTLLFTNFPNGY